MKRQATKGSIVLEGNVLAYQCGSGGWHLPIDRVLAIGEATTPHGPLFDDYFLCFVTGCEGTWHEASFYTPGRDLVLQVLSQRLGTNLEPALCNSTVYRSRVMWPTALVGAPLFEYQSTTRKAWWRRWLQRLGFLNPGVPQQVSQQVLAYLAKGD